MYPCFHKLKYYVKVCIWKLRTHNRTTLKDSVLLSLFLCSDVAPLPPPPPPHTHTHPYLHHLITHSTSLWNKRTHNGTKIGDYVFLSLFGSSSFGHFSVFLLRIFLSSLTLKMNGFLCLMVNTPRTAWIVRSLRQN